MDVELKIPITSLDRLRITDEDHVCQTCGGAPGDQNRDIRCTTVLEKPRGIPQKFILGSVDEPAA